MLQSYFKSYGALPKLRPLWVLPVVILWVDRMMWEAGTGLGFPLACLGIAAAGQIFAPITVGQRRAWIAWGVLSCALIPAVDLVQPLSVAFAFVGLVVFAAILTGTEQIGVAMARLPWFGVRISAADLRGVVAQSGQMKGAAARQYVRDWMVPLGLGLIFVSLFAKANPVLDGWLTSLFEGRMDLLPDMRRAVFWSGIAVMSWPMMRLRECPTFLPRLRRTREARGVFLNARSVMRALILFNALFALQTLTDPVLTLGNFALPDGVTYASFAHKGAYPLLATALLAGGFAILAQPWLSGRLMRALLLIWVVQNMILLASSYIRLDLYVDVYGLTRLRFAALIWMALVAAGLALMLWQIARLLPTGWLLKRAAVLGLLGLYGGAVTNVAGVVAEHNLNRASLVEDGYYICQLGEGALPAIRTYELRTGHAFCDDRGPFIATPRDFREWGYRNYRLRRSLAQIEETLS